MKFLLWFKILLFIFFIYVYFFNPLSFSYAIYFGCNIQPNSYGNANNDFQIDLEDFEIWRKEFISLLNSKNADFNSDDKISLIDFEIWRDYYSLFKNLNIPDKYKNLFCNLESNLDVFFNYVKSLESESFMISNTLFSAELLSANSNRGKKLLSENSLTLNILYLTRLREIGFQAITLAINYPILTNSFFDKEKYLFFYKKIANEAKKIGLKIIVKLGIIFPQNDFGDFAINYSYLKTVDQYFDEKLEMAKNIVEEIRPDYLIISNEPGTEQAILNKRIYLRNYVNYITSAIDQLRGKGVLLGAGIGSWESLDFIKEYAKIPNLDFIDIHVYPIKSFSNDYLMNILTIIEIAKKANKKVSISEFWLYKADQNESMIFENNSKIFKRDVYDFWQLLDMKMIEMMVFLARKKDMLFISPFWSSYLFSYLNYSDEFENSPYLSIRGLLENKAYENMLKGKVSKSGEKFKLLIKDFK